MMRNYKNVCHLSENFRDTDICRVELASNKKEALAAWATFLKQLWLLQEAIYLS